MRQITVERTEGDVAVRQVWETDSPEETFQLGKQLGEACVPGEVYTLTGDLGTGKTGGVRPMPLAGVVQRRLQKRLGPV